MIRISVMGAARQDKTAIIAITKAGAVTGRRLQKALEDSVLYLPGNLCKRQDNESVAFDGPFKELLKRVFSEHKKIVLFVSVGAVVRLLAPLIKSKMEDPAVVVVGQDGKFAISLLSGHIGGANALARQVATALGGVPVITTASELSGTISPDMIGRESGWEIEHKENIKFVSMSLVNGEKTGVYQDSGERDWLPDDKRASNLVFYDSFESLLESDCKAAIIITDRVLAEEGKGLLKKAVVYRPRSLVAGIGCRRGVSNEEIEQALKSALQEKKLSFKSVRKLATVDIKRDEKGISVLARKYGWPVEYFSSDELNKFCRGTACCARSQRIFHRIGTPGVCEPAALMSSGSNELLMAKTVKGNVTIALARASSNFNNDVGAQHAVPSGNKTGNEKLQKGNGKLYLVGLGPGNLEQMTERARMALEDSEIIMGYKSYLGHIDSMLADKEVISSGMGDEVERAKKAIALAKEGRKVALVSGGDAGIYGMAGLVFELLQNEDNKALNDFECEVVPGVPALSAAASLLGAPLMCDFAVINLSDLLVPRESIARRLESAARGDFVIALYNPASHRRKDQIAKAREILLKYRDVSTPTGIVSDAYREGQQVVLTDLGHMLDYEIGMNTLVIIGNSTTFRLGNRMVTPRGYGNKYKIKMTKLKI